MSFSLLPILLLLLPSCHAAFSDLFRPEDVEATNLPYQMQGKWHNTGAKSLGRENGAVQLFKPSYNKADLVRFDIRIYDASLCDLGVNQRSINRFWRVYLGYQENVLSSVTFSGYGTVDSRKEQLVAVHKDTPMKEAYQIINPRDMTFERFSNLSYHTLNDRNYFPPYSYGKDRLSSCLFELRLKLKQLPKTNNYENQFQGEGTLESKTCETKMSISLGNFDTYTSFIRIANSLGIIASILNSIQFVAVCLQVLYGWRTKTMCNISVPTVVALLLLTMHTTTAFSVFSNVVYFTNRTFLAAAITSGICAGAYAGWLVMVWVTQRQKSMEVSSIESVILLAATGTAFWLSYLAMRSIPGAIVLCSLALYAFFIPQIVRNRKSGKNVCAIHPIFAVIAVTVNMFTPVYVSLLGPSFLNTQARPIVALSLAAFLIAQATSLTMQYKRKNVPVLSGYLTIDVSELSETDLLVSGPQFKST